MLYQLPPSTTIYSILLVQFTCLTVFFHHLCPVPLGLGPTTLYPIHFFTQSLSFFRNTCPYHRSLFCCNTCVMYWYLLARCKHGEYPACGIFSTLFGRWPFAVSIAATCYLFISTLAAGERMRLTMCSLVVYLLILL